MAAEESDRSNGPADPVRVAVLDDYQEVALSVTDWSAVQDRAAVTVFTDHLNDEDEVAARLAGFDIVVAMRERTPFRRSLLEQLPALRLLITTGMRNKSVDLDAAADLGVAVCGTDLVPSSTVELTWALILGVVRDLVGEDRRTRDGHWQQTLPLHLAGSTLGVIGLGTLGSRVAAIGRAFGMTVLAWSPHLTDERAAASAAVRVEFDELLRASDVVTIHVPLNDGSRGLLGRRELELLGPAGYLINTSRGPIVDQAALVDALHGGAIAGAGLDVFDVEPLPPGHPLLSTPRTLLSPHVGFVSQRAYQVAYGGVVEDILAWLDGNPMRVLD